MLAHRSLDPRLPPARGREQPWLEEWGFPLALSAASHLPREGAFNLPVYLLVVLPGWLPPFASIGYRFVNLAA